MYIREPSDLRIVSNTGVYRLAQPEQESVGWNVTEGADFTPYPLRRNAAKIGISVGVANGDKVLALHLATVSHVRAAGVMA